MGTALSTGLAGKTNILITLDHKKQGDLSEALDALKIATGIEWSFGTNANQINCLYHDQDSVSDSGKAINIYDSGTLKNAFGDLLTMEAIKVLYIKNTHASLTLEVFGGLSADIPILVGAVTENVVLEIPPGGILVWMEPSAAGIVTTTNKNLRVAAKTTGTVTFDLAIAGLD